MAIKQIKATVRNFIFCECALCKMQMGLFILVWTYANRWAHTTRESSLIEIFASCSCVCVSIYLFSFFFSRKSYLSLLPVKGFFSLRCYRFITIKIGEQGGEHERVPYNNNNEKGHSSRQLVYISRQYLTHDNNQYSY